MNRTLLRISLLACISAFAAGSLNLQPAAWARSGGSGRGADDPGCQSCVAKAATLFSAGKNQDAAELLRSFSDRCPHNEKLHLLLSTILVRLHNQGQEAAEEAGKAAAAAPNSVPAHLQYALTLLGNEDNMHASQEFERVVELDPSNYEAWSSLSGIYAQLHEDEKANQAASRAADLEPSTASVRLQTLSNLQRQGKSSEARAELKRLISSSSTGPGALQQLAAEALNMAAYQEAAQAASKVAESSPRSQAAWKTLGIAQLLGGDNQGCLDTSKKLLALDPKAVEPHALSGAALVAMGKAKDGEKELQRALSQDADLGLAKFGIGRLQFARGDFQAASESLNSCLDADPILAKSPEVSYLMAQSLEKVGEPEQARAYYRQSLTYGLSGNDATQAQESVKRLTVKVK